MIINIKALRVEDNRNGTFSIELPHQEMTPAQRVMLRELFPNTGEKAYELLTTEALIQSVALDHEVMAPKHANKATKASGPVSI